MSVEKRVIAVLRDQFGIPEERITPDQPIQWAFDSLDQVELIMELEEEFDINILDEDASRIQTVAEVIRYVERHLGRYDAGSIKMRSQSPPPDSLWDRELDG